MIARTDFKVYVEGAEKATQQFNAVAAAERNAGEAGSKASKGIDEAGSAMKDLGKKLDAVLGPLRTAANILPGLGLSGIIIAGWEAGTVVMKKLGDMIGFSADQAARFITHANQQADVMAYYATQANAAAVATANLINKQDEAAQKGYLTGLSQAGASGVSGRFIDANREIVALQQQIERLSGQRVTMERNPAGDYYSAETQAKIDELAAAAAAKRAEAIRGPYSAADIEYAASRYAAIGDRYVGSISQETVERYHALLQDAQDLDLQAAHLMETQKLSVNAIDDAVGKAQNRLQDLTKSLKITSEHVAAPKHEGHTKYAKTGSAFELVAPYLEFLGIDVGAIEDGLKHLPAFRKQMEEDFFRDAQPEMIGIEDFVPPGGITDADIAPNPASDVLDGLSDKLEAFNKLGRGFQSMMGDLVSSATDGAAFVGNALSSLSGAVGEHIANIIVAGEFGAKSFRKDIGNILAGLSAQAFGYAVLLEGLAVAAALSGPILGFEAAGLAAAGGVMAGVGTALGFGARALGADPLVGDKKGHGGGGGGGGGGAGGYLHNPYSGGQSDTHVTVVIGGEVVTRGITTETRTIERRGGITEPRLARAQ